MKILALSLVVTLSLFAVASVALAAPADYHPQGSACGQYHGAFQYYSHTVGTDTFWIPTYAQQGGLGDTTGPANSAKGCQSHF